MNQEINKFFEYYNRVFDSNGNILLCGREACKDLIIAGLAVNEKGDFGNISTGMMNVSEIKSLHRLLMESKNSR